MTTTSRRSKPRLPRKSLATLFGSEARARMLVALYRQPERPYRLEDLAAAAGLGLAQAFRLIRQFVKAGLCVQRPALLVSIRLETYGASEDPILRYALRTLVAPAPARALPNPMRHHEERSYRLHEVAAARLQRDPSALALARRTLKRWLSRYGGEAPAALLEWQDILARPVAEVIEVALERTQYGDRIRKSSPLSSLVSAAERDSIWQTVRPPRRA